MNTTMIKSVCTIFTSPKWGRGILPGRWMRSVSVYYRINLSKEPTKEIFLVGAIVTILFILRLLGFLGGNTSNH
jgi:hypothetical protein